MMFCIATPASGTWWTPSHTTSSSAWHATSTVPSRPALLQCGRTLHRGTDARSQEQQGCLGGWLLHMPKCGNQNKPPICLSSCPLVLLPLLPLAEPKRKPGGRQPRDAVSRAQPSEQRRAEWTVGREETEKPAHSLCIWNGVQHNERDSQHLMNEGDALGTMEKLCRQLTYHLSPHSQWRRHRGLVKRKPQACLKAVLAGSPPDNTVDLSGIPLTSRDLERVTSYLQRCGEQVDSVELGFTGLTDDMVLQLLPALSTLPRLTTLALNGNRLTRAVLRDLTDILKDPSKFPNVTWIDLGNNVDIFSLPQPFLLSLRKRSPKQGHLPTILELGEGPGSGEEVREGTVGQEDPGGGPVAPAEDHHEGKETVAAAQT
ncbi:PREDICTED: leucine-rich repeat-containing protein 75A isoform X1 [Cercocebus atys]|uniref:leucine-rich repeat-containing protein 75A isoform X1 n=1 Tax=Cercocebus atys TaxID=9531 RepID=UPI0005F4D873|nr:PREDICTED: leucine-rich repeat-containing protein 75A isoform X1 [Cercocebus atys]